MKYILRWAGRGGTHSNINKRNKRKNTCKHSLPPGLCSYQGNLPTVHPRYTHRSTALPEGPLGCLPSLSLTTKGSWIHLWEGHHASHQLSDASTPSNPPNTPAMYYAIVAQLMPNQRKPSTITINVFKQYTSPQILMLERLK